YQYSPALHSTYYRKITDIRGTPSMGEIVRIFDGSIKSDDSGVAMDSDGYIWVLTGGPSNWKSQLWRSDSVYAAGGSFTLIGCPSSGSTQGVSICIDAADNVHAAYYDNGVSASYAMHRVYNGTSWETVDGIGNGSTGGRDHNCALCADNLGNVHLLYGDNIGDVSSTWYLKYRRWDPVAGMGDPILIGEFPTSLYSGVMSRYFSNIACNELTGEVFVLLRDLTMGGSMCLYHKTLTDSVFSLSEELTPDDSTSNYYYMPRMRGVLYPAFNNTSMLVDMSWEEDRSGSPHEAFHRYALSEGPYLAGFFPPFGLWVSRDTVVYLDFLDPDGIDPSTAIVSVNGVDYSSSDPELSSSGDRIEFRPSTPWTDGTVTVVLEAIDDILGHSTPDTGLTFSFEVDKTPPALSYREPDSGLTFDYVPAGVLIIFDDAGCGTDTMRWHLSINGMGFDPPGGGGVILEGDSMMILDFTAGGVTIPTDDTSWIEFTVWDNPDVGAPNEKTYRWWFITSTDIREADLPQDFHVDVHPNPFNSAIAISLSGGVGASDARSGQVGIEIYDISGHLVADLPVTNCGEPQFVPTPQIWRPEKSLGSGVYLLRAKIGDKEITKRIVYLR
ncbi:T9SS type A sorting domain-containing protein, partial [bacterium]|nr:T9SS type A sorting domain-containing protein [bacterium]